MEPLDFVGQTLTMAQEGLARTVDGLTPYEVAWIPALETNPIGFILWHMTRSQDSLVNSLLRGGKPQVWETGKWYEKMGLNPDPKDGGGRYTMEQVRAFKTPPLNVLMDYNKAVTANTVEWLKTVKPEDLKATLPFHGGREMPKSAFLSIVISEAYQHSGQIALIRGMLRGINK
jgi:hypothetical protein